jgi:hypothetical protein
MFLTEFLEFWKILWSFLGPLTTAILATILILYFWYPEKFEKIVIHVNWALSHINKRFEREAISREVASIVSTAFVKEYRLERVPRIVIEWGEVEDALLDLKKNMLFIVLKGGRANRHENIARALMKAIPELLAPEMKAVYEPRFVNCLSAHIARNLVKEYQPAVIAINEYIASELEKTEKLREIISMLIEVDEQSLLSRILIPELIESARLRYPYRDPRIDVEVEDLIKTLHSLVKGELAKPLICGKYFKLLFIRVARPEKIEAELEPHVKFMKSSLQECPLLNAIYILAAGKNIIAAKALLVRLRNEIRDMGMEFKDEEFEYVGRYREASFMKLYVCRIKIRKS